jgi:vitamin B12 transporter
LKKTVPVLLSGLLFCARLLAGGADTLKLVELPEVLIVQQRGSFYGEDHHVISLGKKDVNSNPASNLGDLLQLKFPSLIRSYGGGAGNLCSVSLRGTTSIHTQVNWNGFPLNSATSGDADLSLFPLVLADRVSIINGASGSLYGSGTFGGAIDITSETNFENRINLSTANETGSFGNQFNAAELGVGNSRLQYLGTLYSRKAENNFPYKSLDFSNSRVSHNELSSWGTMQQISGSLGADNYVSAGIWYQDKKKNVPEILGSLGSSYAEQSDSSLKAFLKFMHSWQNSSLIIKSAYFNDHLRYTDKDAASDPDYLVYSVFHVNQIFNDVSFRKNMGSHLILDAALISDKIYAEVPVYKKHIDELRLSALLASKFKYNRSVINTSIRTERLPNGKLILLPSLGGQYSLIIDKLNLRFNLSRKFRQPTLNEKYWVPGGNPDTRPEHGWGADIGSSAAFCVHQNQCFHIDFSAYSSFIHDYILWTGSGIYLSPKNIEVVWSRGIETSIANEFTAGVWKMMSSLNYGYTRANSVRNYENSSMVGQQLRYIPRNAGSMSFTVTRNKIEAGANCNYVGFRRITESNDALILHSYSLMDSWIGSTFDWKNFSLRSRFQIYNLFNQQYQVLASFPMPGRYFSFSFKIAYLR